MDNKVKKELVALFKKMLDEGLESGKFGDLKPDEGGYLQTEYTITLKRETKRV